MTPSSRYERLVSLFEAVLNPTHLVLEDQSHRHAGHREGGGVETHFCLTISAPCLQGLSAVQQHRRILGLCQDEFAQGLHALEIHVLHKDFTLTHMVGG
jgi:BolA protein